GDPGGRPGRGAVGAVRRPDPVPLRATVQDGHRAAAAPVRHRPPRRAGQGTAASRDRRIPGGGRPARRLLGPEPVLPPLQAPARRHPATVRTVLKNRLNGRKSRQEPAARPTYHSREQGGLTSPPRWAVTDRAGSAPSDPPPASPFPAPVRSGPGGSYARAVLETSLRWNGSVGRLRAPS